MTRKGARPDVSQYSLQYDRLYYGHSPHTDEINHKLHVTLHACKGNDAASVKEECVFVQVIERGYGCVNV